MATYNGQVTGGGLNLRASASTSAPGLIQTPDKTQIVASDYSGDIDWYCTTYSGYSGFVMTEYLTDDSPAPPDIGWRYGIVNVAPDVNIRNAPSASGTTILGRWQTNQIGIVSVSSTVEWYETNWKGKTAYVNMPYLDDLGPAPDWIPLRMQKIAMNEIGLSEPDAYKYYGIASGTAWCQLFVNWLALQAGMDSKLVPTTALTPAGIEWHIVIGNRFWFVSEENKAKMRGYSDEVSSNTVAGLTEEEKAFVPESGDFIYFRWESQPNDHCGHVGYVYFVDTAGGTLKTVEGNVGNKVASRTFKLNDSEIIGYGRLEY